MPIWSRLKSVLEDLRDRREFSRISRIAETYAESQPPGATLTLEQYVTRLSGVQLPTTKQELQFADFVSQAHRWYKHLPANPPGDPFYFYLDKYAGCDRLLKRDGTAVVVERTEPGFHYSDLPTQEYRRRFGHLAYSCESGTAVFVPTWPVSYPRDKVVAAPGDDGKMFGLPAEILAAGETRLTAVIHPGGACCTVCERLKSWPEESGGQIVLEKIAARCREMQDPTNPDWKKHTGSIGYSDPRLDELLAPERQRQKDEIVRAIDRVCAVISRQTRH
jgi:hypothetical protein